MSARERRLEQMLQETAEEVGALKFRLEQMVARLDASDAALRDSRGMVTELQQMLLRRAS